MSIFHIYIKLLPTTQTQKHIVRLIIQISKYIIWKYISHRDKVRNIKIRFVFLPISYIIVSYGIHQINNLALLSLQLLHFSFTNYSYCILLSFFILFYQYYFNYSIKLFLCMTAAGIGCLLLLLLLVGWWCKRQLTMRIVVVVNTRVVVRQKQNEHENG